MSIERVEQLRSKLETSLNLVVQSLGEIQIGSVEQFPFGWRKAAKGRTVWRILEEAITQNLEKSYQNYGFSSIKAADSEVGVYDFSGTVLDDDEKFYVNIKSAVIGSRTNKDDISKAQKLKEFFDEDINRKLFIATFLIKFNSNMTVLVISAKVMPIMWLPDIYINPSNNGNLQSSKYKDISSAIRRTNVDFFREFLQEMEVAKKKRKQKS
ncbi:hypothetical protein [Planktothrix rubescens]|uniref:hypothetical protein n=1 Tax=Planktothrix rubescens TaxID=59512 RepID=UPI000418FE2C|nr:hypothetical protein [Planktothrix rubescens]